MRTICFCNSNIPWGGGEKWHLEAALALASRGWRILFLCHPGGELYKRLRGAAGIRTISLPLGRLSFLNPLLGIRMARFFKREGVDALITNLSADLKATAPAAKAAGVSRIIHRKGSALPVRNTLLNRWLYGKVITRLIVNSRATLRQTLIHNQSLIAPERISILPNGIDVTAFDAALRLAGQANERIIAIHSSTRLTADKSPPAPVWRQGFDDKSLRSISSMKCSGGRPFILGNAGRLNRQKGQHLLLHLCRRLLDAGLDCAVLIAGQGEREAELKALASGLKLGERAVFLGFMENLAPFWRAIDLFVLSSLWEGFGNVLIEAMLARRPVFAFAVSNIPELIFEDGPGLTGNGRLFPLPAEELPHCPDAVEAAGAKRPENAPKAYAALEVMVQAILELAGDPAAAKRMGESGRAFARGFSQEGCMDRLEALLWKR